jgi:hypothetical protein
LRKSFLLDSLGLDLASLTVLVRFVHDHVTHERLEQVVRITIAKFLEGLCKPCWNGRLHCVSQCTGDCLTMN